MNQRLDGWALPGPSAVGISRVAHAVAHELIGQVTRITGIKGRISPQFTATTLMSVASLSSTPHEVMGGRRPNPRKLKAVSARIIEGMESVAEAMRWLMKPGSRWRPMMRPGLAPIIWAAAA